MPELGPTPVVQVVAGVDPEVVATGIAVDVFLRLVDAVIPGPGDAGHVTTGQALASQLAARPVIPRTGGIYA